MDEVRQHQIGQQLRTARHALKLTQQQVADRLGISQSKVTKIEKGQQAIDVIELLRYQKILGVELLPTAGDQSQKNWQEAAERLGLRELASDVALCNALKITDAEGLLLSNVSGFLSPALTKEGYVQLLVTLRAIDAV